MNRIIGSLRLAYIHDFTKITISTSLLRYLLVNTFLFITPFIFDHPQVLLGIIINFMLVYIALNFKKNELLPAVMLPSLAVTLKGTLFGTFTPFLMIMMPVIWLGNAVFILSIRYYAIKKTNLLINFVISSLLKTGILFAVTYLLFSLNVLPEIFLSSMGLMQLITALSAGFIYFLLVRGQLHEN